MVVVVITTAGVEEKEKELELAAHLAHGYHLWKSQLSVPLLYWHSVENKHHQSKTTTCSVIITSKACKTICKYIWHLLIYIQCIEKKQILDIRLWLIHWLSCVCVF